MLTRRETATIVAALLYYRKHSVTVVTSVHLSDHLGREVPLGPFDVDRLVAKLVGQMPPREDESCGCSFDPTSFSDYCDRHRPRPE